MRPIHRILAAVLLICLAVPYAAVAQEPPQAEIIPLTPEKEKARPDTSSDYLKVFNEAFDQAIADFEAENAIRMADIEPLTNVTADLSAMDREDVADAATSSSLPESAASLRDLLSLFVAGLDLGELSGEGENLVLALNPKFFDWGHSQGSGKLTLREATVSEQVLMALPEEVRESRKTGLLDGLNEFDDWELALTWAREGSRIGRDPQDYEALTEHLASALDAELVEVQERADQAIQRLLASGEEVTRDTVETAARAQAQGLSSLWKVLGQNGYFRVGELISNQPQLYADFTGRFRDELLGQDEYGLSVTWEGGIANINGLLRECAPVREGSGVTRLERIQSVTPNCYTGFLDKSTPDWSKRWMVKAEYSETQSDTVELPDDDLVLDLGSAHTFRVSGGFGFDLKPLPEVGNSPARLDFEVMYENVSDDEVRSDDRLLGSLTFVQKVNDTTAATLSIVYANKPELLGEIDEDVSAHVGLKFNLDTGKDSKSAGE